MSIGDFLKYQRNAVNVITVLALAFLTVMWGASLLDIWLDLDWVTDPKVVWVAPIMAIFAVVLRFVVFAIFRFVEAIY